MRLQKYIAKCGVTSRRKAEELILATRVRVNGKLIEELGSKVDPNRDIVEVDGRIISLEKEKTYLALNKPVGYVTTLKDEHNRKTVVDLIKGVDTRVYPVGRLDIDTEGLLILTNDGDLTYKLTHPSFEVEKTYLALVAGRPLEEELSRFRKGLMVDGIRTAPAKVRVIQTYEKTSLLEIKIHEGRNRQVRKMCSAINHPVEKLKRISFGSLGLEGIKLGEFRELSKDEVKELMEL